MQEYLQQTLSNAPESCVKAPGALMQRTLNVETASELSQVISYFPVFFLGQRRLCTGTVHLSSKLENQCFLLSVLTLIV